MKWPFQKSSQLLYSIIDIETTGGNYLKGGKIIEISIIIFNGKKVIRKFTSLVNPNCKIPPFIIGLTKIDNKMVRDAPTFDKIAKKINLITKETIFVAHNILFDYTFIKAEMENAGIPFKRHSLCTLQLSKKILKEEVSYSLGRLCKSIGIQLKNRHRAEGDALATVELFSLLLKKAPLVIHRNIK